MIAAPTLTAANNARDVTDFVPCAVRARREGRGSGRGGELLDRCGAICAAGAVHFPRSWARRVVTLFWGGRNGGLGEMGNGQLT
jgi:hypothetical protein